MITSHKSRYSFQERIFTLQTQKNARKNSGKEKLLSSPQKNAKISMMTRK